MVESIIHVHVPRELVQMAKKEGLVTGRITENLLRTYLEKFKAQKEAFLNQIEIEA